jgi:flagellar biogenesis protein FliO
MKNRLRTLCVCLLAITNAGAVAHAQNEEPKSEQQGPRRVINADFNQFPVVIDGANRRQQDARQQIPLNRPSDDSTKKEVSDRSAAWPWFALLLVVLLIVGIAKVIGRKQSALEGAFAQEVFDILARRAIDSRNSIALIRVGDKLIIVGLSQNGMTTLSEITDQAEVERLTNLSKANEHPPSFNWLGWLGWHGSSKTESATQDPVLPNSTRHETNRLETSDKNGVASFPTGLSVRELEEGGHV